MYSRIYSPNILATGSSQLAENSYSVRCVSFGGVCCLPLITVYGLLVRKRQRYRRRGDRQLHASHPTVHGGDKQDQSCIHARPRTCFNHSLNRKDACSSVVKFSTFDYRSIKPHPGVRSDLFRRHLSGVRVTDFLGGVAHVGILSGDEDAEEMADVAESSEGTSSQSWTVIETITHATRIAEEREKEPWRTRSWTAVALLGGLLGWVFGTG